MAKAASDLPSRMISTVASTGSGSRTRMVGSNSMPTETKNSTAKASRSGKVSSAARWLSGDSLRIMPAKNAPSANETPNSSAAAKAAPRAITNTERRNSSRLPVCAMACSTHGMTRLPTISMMATKAAILAMVMPTSSATEARSTCAAPFPPNSPAKAGSRTRVSTITMSSTISHPTAMRPRVLSTSRRSWSARSRTTVLATESARPNTSPAPIGQPSQWARAMPSTVAHRICTMAPGMAMLRTDSRSSSEKCRPTPNISRITPISASWLARFWSATKPGVNGPIRMPATR